MKILVPATTSGAAAALRSARNRVKLGRFRQHLGRTRRCCTPTLAAPASLRCRSLAPPALAQKP
eukprot:3252509-Alexandrium_andersonii.AAC.1